MIIMLLAHLQASGDGSLISQHVCQDITYYKGLRFKPTILVQHDQRMGGVPCSKLHQPGFSVRSSARLSSTPTETILFVDKHRHPMESSR